MKTTKWMRQKVVLLAAVILLVASAGAESWVNVDNTSDVTILDTRSFSRVTAEEEKPIDSRSYTMDWSLIGTLNTKRISGTIILIK